MPLLVAITSKTTGRLLVVYATTARQFATSSADRSPGNRTRNATRESRHPWAASHRSPNTARKKNTVNPNTITAGLYSMSLALLLSAAAESHIGQGDKHQPRPGQRQNRHHPFIDETRHQRDTE